MNALILACGNYERWTSPTPKQLVKVFDDEILINRTIRQCIEHGLEPIVITQHERIKRECNAVTYTPKRYRYTVETLCNTRELWQGETLILLGDVLYSRSGFEKVYRMHTFAAGTHTELMALKVEDTPVLERVMRENIGKCKLHPTYGKLFTLYRAVYDLPIMPRYPTYDTNFTWLNDGICRDFDTDEQYRSFWVEWSRGALKDA